MVELDSVTAAWLARTAEEEGATVAELIGELVLDARTREPLSIVHAAMVGLLAAVALLAASRARGAGGPHRSRARSARGADHRRRASIRA